MRSPAVLLGFVVGIAAFHGYPLLAFVVLVGYVLLDCARYLRVDE